MFICNECGLVFEDPKTEREYHSECSNGYGTPYEEYGVCPECGCDDYDEMSDCVLCGELTRNYKFCDDCLEASKVAYEELIDRLAEYFPRKNDNRYNIAECINEAIS